jgi:hypothetical protein
MSPLAPGSAPSTSSSTVLRLLLLAALLPACSDTPGKSDARHDVRKVSETSPSDRSSLEPSSTMDSTLGDTGLDRSASHDRRAEQPAPDSAKGIDAGGKLCQFDVDCDDKLACNTDKCSSGKCAHYMDPNYCVIASQCVASGTANPLNPCQSCDPAKNPYAWTSVPCIG